MPVIFSVNIRSQNDRVCYKWLIKLYSLDVCLWQTMIEAHVDVKTTDGFLLRLFCIGFTQRRQNQVKKTAYAQSTQVRAIRRKMVEVMQREVSSSDLKDVVNKLSVILLAFASNLCFHSNKLSATARC